MRRNLVDDIWGYRKGKPTVVNMVALWKEIRELKKFDTQYVFSRGYEVLSLLYNEDGSPTDMTLKQVGEVIGVSLSRIRQNRDLAFAMLRHPFRRTHYTIEDPLDIAAEKAPNSYPKE